MNRVAARVHFPDEMTTLSAPTRSAPLPVDNARLAGVAKTVVRAVDLGKCYHVYEKPADRLKQALL
ncbi:MAG: hypothetical protein JNK70_13185, partial [Phycisphaerae bacterium]|nr:hypothetical protein [Phycisphaerae bacterium]